MYYDKEFEIEIEGCPHGWNYLIALELKNIANELHQSNVLMIKSMPTHMILDSNKATICYGIKEENN